MELHESRRKHFLTLLMLLLWVKASLSYSSTGVTQFDGELSDSEKGGTCKFNSMNCEHDRSCFLSGFKLKVEYTGTKFASIRCSTSKCKGSTFYRTCRYNNTTLEMCQFSGKWSNKNLALCNPCPIGYYIANYDTCKPCPAGTFNDRTDSRTCIPCSKGEYAGREGTVKCSKCPQNHYSNVKGASFCAKCPKVGFAKGEGNVRCERCPAGHVTRSYDTTTCYGPALYGVTSNRETEVFLSAVNGIVTNAGNFKLWKSKGDWYVSESLTLSKGHFWIVSQKFTTDYYPGRYQIVRSPSISFVTPTIQDVFCYSGRGYSYLGGEKVAASGRKCVNYSTTGKGKYCRNYGNVGSSTGLSCHVGDDVWEPCDIPKCKSQGSGSVVECSYVRFPTNTTTTKTKSVFSLIDIKNLSDAKSACDRLEYKCDGVKKVNNTSWSLITIDLENTDSLNKVLTSEELHIKDVDCHPYEGQYFELDDDDLDSLNYS